ncbi:putative calpain-like cysteine peptidase [Leishmania mexicana MHOM/GT/2001/U1103]|uniref:Calpain-like cysteine peptidase n=1 Tax=Leishmania mexicana (strain MHOM/GT/2001/U1103) TaxID=929439 RepID=E9B2M1_LEIMU|nr:putative calpain-like cysteine peptidase [Leishmania mexicana MHOM/GT/2001/U1103]CBZ29484.1 putative calpain-like cysteine peptidase [Leishmania mexicana MHOM/GT/2001/U1103]
MPSKASSVPSRTAFPVACSSFVNSRFCSLPLWDDAQVAQENWGGPLAVPVPSGGGDGGKEAKQSLSRPKPLTGGRNVSTCAAEMHFEDEATRHSVEVFIASLRPPLQSDPAAGEVCDRSSPDEVTWLRPAEVFSPFRPVVHRNVTPFVNPYATAEGLVPVDAKAEEARCQELLSAAACNANSSTGHRKSAGLARQSDVATPEQQAFHLLYPETISVLDTFSHEERELWSNCTPTESVRRYRALPTLMQPYDGALIAGCAETPAQACESRYSTSLRHKLKQAEQLAALTKAPPFLMSAFNSALLAVEQAQRYVPEGWYLWELVYPHAPGTCHPVYNPFGKYAVKLFVDGAYRKVLVDDCLPVDVLGRPLLSTTSRKELWPCLIAKAVLKALGAVSGVQALTSSPELIVATLLGNWVPQYLSPRHNTVSATALLLLYQRQLTQLESLAEPFVKESIECASRHGGADGTGDVTGKDGRNSMRGQRVSVAAAPQKRTPPTGAGKPSVRQRQSSRSSRVSGDDKEEEGTLKPLRATEYCEPVIDEPLPEQPIYVCSLHAPPADALMSEAGRTARGGYGSGPQLYTIHAMRPFRNTVALLLHTTPRTCLSEGIFEEDKDADDVSALHDWSSRTAKRGVHAASAVKPPRGLDDLATVDVVGAQGDPTPITDMVVMDHDRAASVTSCWLTLEEFMSCMDTIIVWRKLSGRYTNAVSVSGESLLRYQGHVTAAGDNGPSESSSSAASRKKSPPARCAETSTTAAAASGVTTQPPAPSRPSSMWWKLTAEKAVEAVAIVSCPALTEADGCGTLAEKVPLTMAPLSHSWLSVGLPDKVASGGESLESAEAQLQRRVHFHNVQWDRAEPLNHIGSLTYANGVLCSTVLYFRPGVHLIRVDLHHVQAADKISFLSDAEMDVQLDLSHDANRDGFACVTDAGVYPAVQSCDTENVWLKRVFSLAAPTCVTLQLSTLDSTEDVGAHRQLYTAASRASAGASSGRGGGNHSNVAAGGRGAPQGGATAAGVGKSGNASLAPGATAADGKKRCEGPLTADAKNGATSTVPDRDASVPILRFTSLMLVNLDYPEDCCVGTAGRLVKVRLKPNEKGYLIMAYTVVPSLMAENVQRQNRVADVAGGRGSLLPTITPMDSLAEEEGLQPPESPSLGNSFSPAASLAPPPLFPAGRWKLVLRSDAEVQTFETVAHDLNNVVIVADLPRGESPVLFRRTCMIAETTHVSIVADLRAPVPMPYTVRIVRLSTATASTSTATTPRALRGPSNNILPAGMSEPLAADTGRGAAAAFSCGSMFVVYESPPTERRLFVADVLLSAAADTSLVKGGKGPATSSSTGGGMTAYVFEATVSEADAAAWNERCCRSQEDAFLQYRDAAEEQASASNERDLAEYQRDPVAFAQRKREASAQRRQFTTEAAEKAIPRPTTIARKRSGMTRRQSHHLSAGLENLPKDSLRRRSSCAQPETEQEGDIQQNLDNVDPNTTVRMSVHLSFSISRADVKAETPVPDALAELRKHMRETVSWLQEWNEPGSVGGESAAAACSVTPMGAATSSAGKSAAQRGQRDAAAAAATVEDALRAEAARQSRIEYLRNPKHLFVPSFDSEYNTDGAETPTITSSASFVHRAKHDASGNSSGTGAAHSAATGGTQGARSYRREPSQASVGTSASLSDEPQSPCAPPVLMQDGPATQFRYAAPLQQSQHCIELLPLRSWEESPSVSSQGKDGAGGTGPAGAAASIRAKRLKSSGSASGALSAPARPHVNGPVMTSGTSPRFSAEVAPSGLPTSAASAACTLSCPLTAAERETILLPLRRPLTEASESWDLALSQARVAKSESQAQLRSSFHAYYEAMVEQRAVSGDMSGTAVPIVYHSLLGLKEEELGVSLRSTKPLAFT